MSERPSLTDLAAREIARASRPPSEGDRLSHIALMERVLREQRVAATRRRWTAFVLAAAAIIVVRVAARHRARHADDRATVASASAPRAPSAEPFARVTSGAPSVVRREPAPTGADGSVRAGDRVIAGAEVATIALATGTRLAVDPGGDLAVVEDDRAQIFALDRGAVRADVAKLHDGERFVVRTDDAEVEVRGTSFRVERLAAPSPCRATSTRVVVTEGVVVVRSGGAEARVPAGTEWPPPCPVASASGSASAATARVPSTAPSGGAQSSELAAANDLFAKAEAARKGGDPRKAVALFDRLLAEHPSSPIVEHAFVERMRSLDGYDRGRAVDAAREYLARWPRGFARAEAEAIVALGP